MGDDSRARMMEQIQRLRGVMDENEIFDLSDDGRVYLSLKASRKLAAFAVEDAETWWEANHPAAAEAATAILADPRNRRYEWAPARALTCTSDTTSATSSTAKRGNP